MIRFILESEKGRTAAGIHTFGFEHSFIRIPNSRNVRRAFRNNCNCDAIEIDVKGEKGEERTEDRNWYGYRQTTGGT